jgi:uridine phosphorylase
MVYPIIEYDPTPSALIEPARLVKRADAPEHCVICFFKEVIEQVAAEHQAKVLLEESNWEDGPHRVYEITHQGQRLAFLHPGVGAPIAASMLEEAIALGCSKFIACGGCGVLKKDIAVGNLIVVSAGVRDEGVSYHYLPPSREVEADPRAVQALIGTLKRGGLPHRLGKTWTTDAPYRETAALVASRLAEGCLTVEMENSALAAVAQFRNVVFGQALYGGDDLSGAEWDNRGWQSRQEVRQNLFWLCAEACLAL